MYQTLDLQSGENAVAQRRNKEQPAGAFDSKSTIERITRSSQLRNAGATTYLIP